MCPKQPGRFALSPPAKSISMPRRVHLSRLIDFVVPTWSCRACERLIY
jgi:hypothetical protein